MLSSPPPKGWFAVGCLCSEEDVNHLLLNYKLKTASGPESISNTMLHNTASSISPALPLLFNLSLRSGKLPSDWKTSNVTPVHKSGSTGP